MKNSIREYFKLDVILLSIFVVGSILVLTSYTSLGMVLRTIGEIGIIIISIASIKFKISDPKIYLILLFSFYPILVASIGVYYLNISGTIIYSLYMMLYFVFLSCVVEKFKYRETILLNVIYLSMFMLIVFLVFRDGNISFNLKDMINSIVNNERYGNNIQTERISIGFSNVNSLGMTASFLTLLSIFNIGDHRHVIISFVGSCLGVILILNSGSRTPIISLSIAAIVYVMYKIRNVFLTRSTLLIIFSLIIMAWSLFAFFLLNNNVYNDIYNSLDEFMSYRLSFSKINSSNIYGINDFLGIGPMSTSDLNQLLSNGQMPIDSSIAYYIITIGRIGFALVIAYVIYLARLTLKTKKGYAISALIYYLVYVIFENILFIPNSAVSTFILIIIFLNIGMKQESIEAL